MNALIETLNRWGEAATPLAGQMLWQSSLLIVVLLALDLLLRHRIRAGFRYALWMLLLVKLVLPPSLALPTGAGYWIERPVKAEAPVEPPVAEVASLPAPTVEVNHAADPGIVVEADFFDRLLAEAMTDAAPATTVLEAPTSPAPTTNTPAVQLTWRGQLLAAWFAGTWLLLGWLLWRWRWVNRLVRASEPAPADLKALLADLYRHNVCRTSCPTPSVLPAACRQSGRDRHSVRSGEVDQGATALETNESLTAAATPGGALGEPRPTIEVRLTDAAMSPAVCGLFRPVILLPRKLAGKLSREQLGTVLLHELIHLRRRDLWVNCVQTLLQIAAWWHPLLWLANARIRRVREEAVDEAVACALRDDADAYPTTLLEVAKLTFTRPLMTLGLVGILESKHALKQRIRRLLDLPPLESTRLKWWQWVAVAAIALTALPMAEGQRATDQANDSSVDVPANAESKPAVPLQLETREYRLNPNTFYQSVERIADSLPPYTNSSGAILKGSQAFQSATEADGLNMVNHFVRAYFEKFGVKLEPPKAVFFNVRKGSLLVRATLQDLDIIQRAIEALSTEPPQITLEVRVVEVPMEDSRATRFSWFLGADLVEVNLTTNNPMAILTDPQFRIIIKALEQREGVDLKFVPRVTTLSGRNTELKLRGTPLIVAPKFGPQFDKLEVNPYALVDRENLQMTIIATIRARMVDDQGKGSPHAYSVSQKALATAMKDGQTLMFAVSASLDDSEEKSGKTETLVFITPTLIDPVGNRVNETQIFENQGSLPPQSGTESPVITLSNMLAAAQADFEKATSERSTALERLHISDVWMLDKSVLEHSFVRRHLEELNVNPPAEFLELDKRYQSARILRDSISMKLAQEKINESLGHHPAPVDLTNVRMVFQQQFDSAERDMELAREEYRALQEKLGPDPLTRPDQALSKEEFLRLMPVIQASIRLNQSSNSVQSARDRLAEVEARTKDQGSLSPQSSVGNPAAGAPRQLAAVNTTRPPITMQVRAVKLSRRAWQELTNRLGTQVVSGQAQAFIHPEAGLDDWLAGHAEVETIESGRITAPERRTSILGAGSTDGAADAASRARIELTTWRDTQATNQVWLQLNAAINWSGPVTIDGGPAPAATGADAAATGSAGVTFGTNTRGYVNQQLATAGVKLTAGQWAIIGGPAEGQTAGPVFAVVASPLFAQNAGATPKQERVGPAGASSDTHKPAAPTTPGAPDRRATKEDINALGFDWLRSPPFKLPHTNLTEYGAQMITVETLFPDPRVSGYRMVGLEPRFVLVPVEGLSRALGGQLPLARPLIIASNELAALTNSLIEAGAVDHSSASPVRFSKMSGGVFHWQVAEGEPSQVMFQTADNPATNAAAASPRQIVFGARHSVPAFAPDWVPLTLLARPFAGDDDTLHSILSLTTGEQQPVVLAQAEETIPPGGSLVWASTNKVRDGFAQAVILHNSGPPAEEADESDDGAGEAAAKIQNARELIETGKLDEAEALLREAAVSSTAPTEVYYHLDRIQQLKSADTQRSEALETRVFRVNPNTFNEALKVVMTNALPPTPAHTNVPAPAPIVQGPGGGGIRFLTVTNDMSAVNLAVRDYFEKVGVKFEPPKMIYFNDRTGMLMVKATLADLEIVQRAVEMLNYEPPQVTLEVRTVEATKADVRAMGFDNLVNAASNDPAKTTNTVAGVGTLTDPQTRLALSALAARPGVVVHSLPPITTLSGRQTQIKLSDAASDNAGQPDPVSHRAGSVMDVIPYVSMDGHVIHMAILSTLTEFPNPVEVENPVNVPPGTDVVISSMPLPSYRLRQVASNVKVWDGQTVVIGYPKIETTRITEDKVPLLGDLPWIGRLFRDENTETETKHTLIFITPTIIDPAGNRVHSAEQMPFTKEQVPRQPGQE